MFVYNEVTTAQSTYVLTFPSILSSFFFLKGPKGYSAKLLYFEKFITVSTPPLPLQENAKFH